MFVYKVYPTFVYNRFVFTLRLFTLPFIIELLE